MQVTVEQISSEVETLSMEDLRKVRKLVDSLLVKKEEAKRAMSEDEFEQYLYKKGVIGKLNARTYGRRQLSLPIPLAIDAVR